MLPALLLFVGLLAASSAGLDDLSNYHLVWSDEFDTLDTKKWKHEISASGGDVGSFAFMSNDTANSFVRNGVLYVKPTLLEENTNPKTGQPFGANFLKEGTLDVEDIYGTCTDSSNDGCLRTGANGDIPPVASAMLETVDSFNFTYGRVEVRAKLAIGDWLWPAIWMLPVEDNYGDWPASGEIDIASAIGNIDFIDENNQPLGIRKVSSIAYWGPSAELDRSELSSGYAMTSRYSNFGMAFHNYTLDWNPDGLSVYVDGRQIFALPDPQSPDFDNLWEYGKQWEPEPTNPWQSGSKIAPFDQPFYIILNVDVGSLDGFFPDSGLNRDVEHQLEHVKPWSNDDQYVDAMKKFYDRRDSWKPTWIAEGGALQVDYVRVYKRNE